ncbi:tetratricopeptide repeat protein [Pseudarthrobacter sp. SORGH_AS 212]|uniref:tetratricopeptide repeat protein n=1 Tax=Pseudarthrobacter sp. SORGH_AS 212 TaxID=3041777 RepID=UPI0032B7E5F0
MVEIDAYMSGWTPVERAYSLWLRAAREQKGTAVRLATAVVQHLRKAHGLRPGAKLSELGVKKKIDGAAIGRWEKGTGGTKPQPVYPDEEAVRKALIAVVTDLVPLAPVEMEWVSFQDVCTTFAVERLKRQHRGAGILGSYAARERNKERHQFLAAWPSPAAQIDPIGLGLGSWAFDGALPPYVERTPDYDLAHRIKEPGITTVTGAPKSGKSRSLMEILQQQHPDAVTWWVNPAPTVLPLLVESARKTKKSERPVFVVLDDAGLIGTDPISGLTAQRLSDLVETCTHLIVVVHDEVIANWEHQLTSRAWHSFESSGMGATRELMNLLRHRISYSSTLDEEEAQSATKVYEDADQRVRGFDLNRLGETLAGVEMLRNQVINLLESPTSVEAALIEAAIDASMSFPTGATFEILGTLAAAHYRQRQPNRPWREHLLFDAFDSLTTGITKGSPHAILVTADHDKYRLLDALAPEFQHPDRATLDTLRGCQLPQEVLNHALLSAAAWYFFHKPEDERIVSVWTECAEQGDPRAMVLLALRAREAKDVEAARTWWKRAADHGLEDSMFQLEAAETMRELGNLADLAGDARGARAWWERAAEQGDADSMLLLSRFPFEAGDLEEAVVLWKRAARHGNSTAMLNLGVQAKDAGNLEKAQEWWERAAEIGDASAMHELGNDAYTAGDSDSARDWWKRAANLGNEHAMVMVGLLASQADDIDSARSWLRLAADKGEARAIFELGALDHTAGDLEMASFWWQRSADKGNTAAMCALANMAHDTNNLESASDLWERAAEHGSSEAMFNLGTMASNSKETKRWWHRASNNGDTKAMFHLGALYDKEGNVENAQSLWERAAASGHAASMCLLGELAADTGDTASARNWWEKAARNGDAIAMTHLGNLSSEAGNQAAAITWWKRAADSGISEAMSNLGVHAYKNGDLDSAQDWWRRAAENGDTQAMLNLGELSHGVGDKAAATTWWKQAAASGNTEAIEILASLAEN